MFLTTFSMLVLPVASNMYTEMSMAMKVPTNKNIIVSSVVQCLVKCGVATKCFSSKALCHKINFDIILCLRVEDSCSKYRLPITTTRQSVS